MDTCTPLRPSGLSGSTSVPLLVMSSATGEAREPRASVPAAAIAPAAPRPALRSRRRSGSATASARRRCAACRSIAPLLRLPCPGALLQHGLHLALGGIDREAVRQPGHRIVVAERDLVGLVPAVGGRRRAARAQRIHLAVGHRVEAARSEEHTLNSSHQIISYAVFC